MNMTKLVQIVIVSVMDLGGDDSIGDDDDDCEGLAHWADDDDDNDDNEHNDHDDGDDDDAEDDEDCEGQAPRADVLFKRRPPPRWIHGQQVSPSSSLSSLSGCR